MIDSAEKHADEKISRPEKDSEQKQPAAQQNRQMLQFLRINHQGKPSAAFSERTQHPL